jgi:hypothetical protein
MATLLRCTVSSLGHGRLGERLKSNDDKRSTPMEEKKKKNKKKTWDKFCTKTN